MGENSKIEWTDHTFNPWIGCTKVHVGCAHCYAESLAKRTGSAQWGPHGTRIKTADKYWEQPLKWQRDAAREGLRRRVFCASLADVFEDWPGPISDRKGNAFVKERDVVGPQLYRPAQGDGDYLVTYLVTMDDLRRDLFALIDATPMLDWLLLTKRPENVRRMWQFKHDQSPAKGICAAEGNAHPYYRPNVWLGTSISDQATADKYVPELLNARDLVPVLFLSAEPLLGPVDLTTNHFLHDLIGVDCHDGRTPSNRLGLDWVIVGGESGHGARPMHPAWARSLRDQCQAANVSFHFKQWGEWLPRRQSALEASRFRGRNWGTLDIDGQWFPLATPWNGHDDDSPDAEARMIYVGKAAAGRLLDGRTWEEFPEVAHG